MYNESQSDANVWVPPTKRDLADVELIRKKVSFYNWTQERVDKYYQDGFSTLFLEINDLVKMTFGGDGNLSSNQSPWVHEYPKEFYEFVESVAHPDPLTKHWDGLLRNQVERIYLVQAIIMKVLDEHVFSTLMFGADADHEDVLKCEDASLLTLDGFRRSKLRAHTNKSYLRMTQGVPPLFWKKTDRITIQIMNMLLPLYNVVGEAYPDRILTWDVFYQMLHDIVAQAAWLNVATRLSASILLVSWAIPGENFEQTQANLWQATYDHSRTKATEYDIRHNNRVSRKPRVKISAAPTVMRYKLADDGKNGYTSYKVMKSHCVYYQGLMDDGTDKKLMIPLLEHVRRARSPLGQPPLLAVLSVMALAFFFGLPFLCLNLTPMQPVRDTNLFFQATDFWMIAGTRVSDSVRGLGGLNLGFSSPVFEEPVSEAIRWFYKKNSDSEEQEESTKETGGWLFNRNPKSAAVEQDDSTQEAKGWLFNPANPTLDTEAQDDSTQEAKGWWPLKRSSEYVGTKAEQEKLANKGKIW